MTTKQVSVRLAAVGGRQVKAELVDIGAAGSRSFQQLDRSARIGGGGLQNLGFQVQDFAVQVGAGTSATQALAQQLPQLLSGFGLLGIAIGTATAVAIPLGSALFGVGQEAQRLDTILRDMDASVKALEETSRAFSAGGIQDLINKYGELNAEVLLLLQRQREIAVDEALGRARDAIAATNAEIDSIFSNRIGDLADFLGVEESVRQVDNFGNAIRAVNPVIRDVEAALEAVSTATTFDEQASAVSALLTLLEGTAAEGTELYDNLVQAEDALRRMVTAGGGLNGWLDSAIAGAADLAGQLWNAASAALSIGSGQSRAAQQIAASEEMVYSGRGGDPRQFIAGESGSFNRTLFEVPVVRRSGGGGGGGAARQSDQEREAARIFEQTRTEAEKYATELEKLNELQSGGFLTADTYARAMEQLKEKTGETADAMKTLEQSVGSAFTSFVTGAKSGREALSDLLGTLAETLANSAFQSIAGSLFGDGSFLSGIFGGARAAGGPVKGGRSYLVGEYGPERVTMAGDGYVTSNADLRRAATSGGGGVTISIDARGSVEGEAERIGRIVRAQVPEIIRASVSANRAASVRGR